MAGFFQAEPALVGDLGHGGVLGQGQPGLGQQHIDIQHTAVAKQHGLLLLGDLGGEGLQNALHLGGLLAAQLHDLGVGLHHGGGLHKQSGTRGGHVVDDASHLAPELGLYRHHEPAVSDGDHGVLQIFVGVGIFDHLVQPVPDAALGLADLAAQLVELVAGGVGHLLLREDGFGDLLFQGRLGGHAVEQIVHRQHIVLGDMVPLIEGTEVAQHRGTAQQLGHGQHAALAGALHNGLQPLHRGKPGRAVFQQQSGHAVGLAQGPAGLVGVLGGRLLQQPGPGLAAQGIAGGPVQDLVQFQGLVVFIRFHDFSLLWQ